MTANATNLTPDQTLAEWNLRRHCDASERLVDDPSESDATLCPLRDCTPWCEDGDQHRDMHPEDRYCTSCGFNVLTTLGEPQDYGKGEWRLPWLEVFLRREANSDQTKVGLHSEHYSFEVEMTPPDEARTLITALSNALELLDR